MSSPWQRPQKLWRLGFEMTAMKHGQKQYSYTMGSDVVRDGMYIEVSDQPNGTNAIIEVFYSDVSHEMSVTLFRPDVPLAVLEWAIALAHRRLPARADRPD